MARIIPAIEIDARANNIAIADQIGDVIKAYTDSQVAKVTPDCIVYKLESENGNLAGYIVLKVTNDVANVFFMTLRPAFLQFSILIDQLISNFISNNSWQQDFLN